MKPKLYFATDNDEVCYTLAFHIMEAPKGTKVLELYEAVPYKQKGFAWCKAYEAPIDTNEKTCNRFCKMHSRTGKSRICKHHSNTFYEPGKLVNIEI